ncbi:hypothetical protein KY285_005212 [Solanum tuberosum]|nr:hypothetical protein KY284_005441 [Solanum tuberosum]KAH0752064.1 hypothetical protein KY285_005212 [Solanum tuberosum]
MAMSGVPLCKLIEGGNTDNFVQARVAKFLNLSVDPALPFLVVVGSGQRLRYDGVLVTRESPGTPPYPPDMDSLLASYEDVFCKPQGLPPAREQDHAIHLNPGSRPVNVKPYRYPYF